MTFITKGSVVSASFHLLVDAVQMDGGVLAAQQFPISPTSIPGEMPFAEQQALIDRDNAAIFRGYISEAKRLLGRPKDWQGWNDFLTVANHLRNNHALNIANPGRQDMFVNAMDQMIQALKTAADVDTLVDLDNWITQDFECEHEQAQHEAFVQQFREMFPHHFSSSMKLMDSMQSTEKHPSIAPSSDVVPALITELQQGDNACVPTEVFIGPLPFISSILQQINDLYAFVRRLQDNQEQIIAESQDVDDEINPSIVESEAGTYRDADFQHEQQVQQQEQQPQPQTQKQQEADHPDEQQMKQKELNELEIKAKKRKLESDGQKLAQDYDTAMQRINDTEALVEKFSKQLHPGSVMETFESQEMESEGPYRTLKEMRERRELLMSVDKNDYYHVVDVNLSGNLDQYFQEIDCGLMIKRRSGLFERWLNNKIVIAASTDDFIETPIDQPPLTLAQLDGVRGPMQLLVVTNPEQRARDLQEASTLKASIQERQDVLKIEFSDLVYKDDHVYFPVTKKSAFPPKVQGQDLRSRTEWLLRQWATHELDSPTRVFLKEVAMSVVMPKQIANKIIEKLVYHPTWGFVVRKGFLIDRIDEAQAVASTLQHDIMRISRFGDEIRAKRRNPESIQPVDRQDYLDEDRLNILDYISDNFDIFKQIIRLLAMSGHRTWNDQKIVSAFFEDIEISSLNEWHGSLKEAVSLLFLVRECAVLSEHESLADQIQQFMIEMQKTSLKTSDKDCLDRFARLVVDHPGIKTIQDQGNEHGRDSLSASDRSLFDSLVYVKPFLEQKIRNQFKKPSQQLSAFKQVGGGDIFMYWETTMLFGLEPLQKKQSQ